MCRIFFVTLLLIGSLPITGFATGQEPDVLIFESKSHDLFSNPLEPFFGDDETKRPKFWIAPNKVSSGNWRGYKATWEISDNRLYLVKIESWFCEPSIRTKNGCRKVTIRDLFGKTVAGDRVFAEWYSDKLRVPNGKQLQYIHSGYASIYERDIVFEVRAGKIVKREIIDNTKGELPSEREIVLQELERLKAKATQAKQGTATKSSIITNNLEPFVISDSGWGSVIVGAKRKDIETVLGKGEHDGRRYDDVYFVEYPQQGVQISYINENDQAHAIFFYNKQTYYGEFVTAPLKTDKGIGWSSSPDDVIEAYGKPPRDFGDESGGNWRRLEYDKIDFLFEGGRMTRISLSSKNCTGCKE